MHAWILIAVNCPPIPPIRPFIPRCVKTAATGCASSLYGCCPDGVLAASDRSLSNCQTPEERCKSDGRYWNGTPKFECSDKSPKDECESEGKVWDGTACKSTDSGTTTGCPPATPHKCSDGSCSTKKEECPGYQAPATGGSPGTGNRCPGTTPYACSDGSSCMMKKEECPGYQAPSTGTGKS